MVRTPLYIAAALGLLFVATQVRAVDSLKEAERVATDSSKLILIDFELSDCPNCTVLRRDLDSDPLLAIALKTVVHLPVDVLSDQGKKLAERYEVGYNFPLFLLADNAGREIRRWAGYVSSDQFVQLLNEATSDLTTIEQREARLKDSPNCADALYLAAYYFDLNRYAEAASTYRQLDSLPCNKLDHSFRVFQAVVELAWREELPFDSARAAADQVIGNPKSTSVEIGRTVQLLTRLARRTNHVDSATIAKYLDTGMVATGYKNDQVNLGLHLEILADYALYVKHDTATALQVKEKGLGKDWERDPRRYFEYAQFCLEHRLDLERAENFARQAADQAEDGAFKARHLQVLADIIYAEGRTDEAMKLMRQAIDLSPVNRWYQERLDEMKHGRRR